MATTADWRTTASTDYFEALDLEDLAFEFISRDPKFQAERAALDRRVRNGRTDRAQAIDALRESWGLSFRRERSSPPRTLGTASVAQCGADRSGAARLRWRARASRRKPS
jgi:hypothetical protein